MSTKSRIFLVVLYALLALPNLGVRTLWQDEAETALVARVVEKRGLPFAFDEQGPISQDWTYQFSVSPLWRWHPWLQFYVAAASFKLLGMNALSARLPFVVVGIVAYWYFLRFLKKHGPKDRGFIWMSALFFLFSAPLLLHIRQSRYYALSLLFTLVTIDGYLDAFKNKSSLRYIFGSILLFHSFLPGALALQGAFFINTVALYLLKKIDVSVVKRWVWMFFLTLPFTLPWSWWMHIGPQNLNFDKALVIQHIRQHYIYIHKFIFPFFLLLAFLLKPVRWAFFKDRHTLLFSIIIATNLALFTINHPYFFRYLIPLIPLFIYLSAWILRKLPLSLSILGLGVMISMTVNTFPGYLYEITHQYYGTNERLVAAINSPSSGDAETVAVNYDDFMFRFHTNKNIIGAQQLPQLNSCPDVVVTFPGWGNEDRLRNIAEVCSLKQRSVSIPFDKLADDPSPVTHRFSPPTDGSVALFVSQSIVIR